MANPLNPAFRRPNNIPEGAAHPSVKSAIQSHDNSITDLNQAVVSLKGQITDITSSAAASSGTSTNTTTSTENITNVTIAGGVVNNQTGVTAYTTAQGDDGALIVFNDTDPIAVTLNNSVTLPWYCFIYNGGTSNVTATGQQGTVNGQPSEIITPGLFSIIFFDGSNWFAAAVPIVPATLAVVAHMFVTGYNASTGIFSTAQPTIPDVSGLLAALALLAPLASPAFTGVPTTPTASPGTNTTQIASTAFVQAAVTPLAPIASPTFTGTVTEPTPPILTSATTATSATAGAATALPVTPLGYLEMSINSVIVKVPYYSV